MGDYTSQTAERRFRHVHPLLFVRLQVARKGSSCDETQRPREIIRDACDEIGCRCELCFGVSPVLRLACVPSRAGPDPSVGERDQCTITQEPLRPEKREARQTVPRRSLGSV